MLNAQKSNWPKTDQFIVGINEVHVWRAHLDVPSTELEALKGTLSDTEKARAGRFKFQRDSARFVTSRGVLRTILGSYLHKEPSEIQIDTQVEGKPCLREAENQEHLYFNLSHSQGLGVYAICKMGEIGIDVELIRDGIEVMELAERNFSKTEIEELKQLPQEERLLGFYLGWTRKEAYLKAEGTGLQVSLDSFAVSLDPRIAPRLISPNCSEWEIQSIEPAPGYVGAVVVHGMKWTLKLLSWGSW